MLGIAKTLYKWELVVRPENKGAELVMRGRADGGAKVQGWTGHERGQQREPSDLRDHVSSHPSWAAGWYGGPAH